ncbi:hypothetical protein ACRALDRAFT_2017117 [Sodiomyces alcalophilus JCM 7366]|uniref:uncharacterized protein n=1 Tax=Sodiomyces alcalophilus JCM 7366 TaxID=591952 RepID=UPI0039B519F1
MNAGDPSHSHPSEVVGASPSGVISRLPIKTQLELSVDDQSQTWAWTVPTQKLTSSDLLASNRISYMHSSQHFNDANEVLTKNDIVSSQEAPPVNARHRPHLPPVTPVMKPAATGVKSFQYFVDCSPLMHLASSSASSESWPCSH